MKIIVIIALFVQQQEETRNKRKLNKNKTGSH